MSLPEHISESQLAAYRERALSPDDLVLVADHLAACGACRDKLAGLPQEQRLLAAFHPNHLNYEALEALVQGGSAGLEHVADCEMCAGELRDLQVFQRRLPRQKAHRYWVPAVGLAFATLLIFILFTKDHAPSERPAANVAELQDGPGLIALDATGGLHGLHPATRQQASELAEALRSGRLPAIPLDPALASPKEVLLGGNDREMQLQVLRPKGTLLSSDTPVFRWEAPAGSRSFRVAIYDDNFAQIAQSPVLETSSWTPKTPLPRGRNFRWTVSAVIAGKRVVAPSAPDPEAKFRIATAAQLEELEALRRSGSPSQLQIAITAARLGLRDDALEAIAALERMNPSSALPTKLRESIKK